MTASAVVASSPERPHPPRSGSPSGREAYRNGRGLAFMTFRELFPIQIAIQGFGILILAIIVIVYASGIFASLKVGEAQMDNVMLGGFAPTALLVATFASMIHGGVMSARTAVLLRAGMTRGAIMLWLIVTGLLLGAAAVALCGLLTIPDVVLEGRIEGLHLILLPPQTFWISALSVLLLYLVGAFVSLLFTQRPWWLGVLVVLVGINAVAACVERSIAQWGTPWVVLWIGAPMVLAAAMGLFGTWSLLRRYEP